MFSFPLISDVYRVTQEKEEHLERRSEISQSDWSLQSHLLNSTLKMYQYWKNELFCFVVSRSSHCPSFHCLEWTVEYTLSVSYAVDSQWNEVQKNWQKASWKASSWTEPLQLFLYCFSLSVSSNSKSAWLGRKRSIRVRWTSWSGW